MGFCDNPDAPKKKKRRRKPSHSSGLNAGHRVRSQPSVVEQLFQPTVLQPGDLAFPIDPILMSVPYKHQTMYDTHGFIQNWYNPVLHEKYDGVTYHIPEVFDDDGDIVTFGNECPGFVELFRSSLPFLSPAELDELALKSENQIKTIVSAEMDLFNFLREIIEAVSGNIEIVKDFWHLSERMLEAYKKALARFKADPKTSAAANWLAWNFAIKPFLSDLKALLCSAAAISKKLEWLRKTNNKVFYRTYSAKFQLPVDTDEWHNGQTLFVINKADPPESANGQYVQQLKYHSVKLEYVARGKMFLSLPEHLIDGAHNGIGALWAAYNGLTNPVAVVWEMIPFSWLIDYFLDYRARLFQTMYDANPFNSGVRVQGFGHSFKWTAIAVGRIARVTTGGDTTTHADAGRVDFQLYRREAGLPYTGQAGLFRVPEGWYKASIMAALDIQLLPKRRRRKSRRR